VNAVTNGRSLPLHVRAQRFWTVGWAFLRVYAGYKWLAWRHRDSSDAVRDAAYAKHHQWSAEKIYDVASQLQGLLIKTCQFISARADIAPEEYVSVLSRLQDQVPPRPWPQVEPMLVKELGGPPSQIFAEFDVRPIASASLAQVHRARLHSGEQVAVKIQYPDIDLLVDTDLKNLRLLVSILARLERDFDYRTLMDEIARYVPKELDFLLEGRSSERIAEMLAYRGDVVVPKVHWELSTRRVLVMEFVHGIKVSDTDAMEAAGIDKQEVSRILLEAYSEMLLVQGFFHADPHPGNVMVQEGPKVVFLDFGLCKELPEDFRRTYVELSVASIRNDRKGMADGFYKIGFRTKEDDPRTFIALGQSFWESMGDKPYVDRELMPEVNQRIARILKQNPVTKVPPDFLLIFRVLGLMSGLSKRLDSRHNVSDTIREYAERSQQDEAEASAAAG
jgi:predicted unusual protein kinase regulating ubiquinone biosynthesis (AarF/ABC1/UbiB family)